MLPGSCFSCGATSSPQQPKEAGCELWGRKNLQNTVRPPRQSPWGKNVSVTEKVPVHLSSTGPKQHTAEQGGMAAGRDGQHALLDKQPPCCQLYAKSSPTLEADMHPGRRRSVLEILMPSCSRGLLGLHWFLAQPSSHNPCLHSHTLPLLSALPRLSVYGLFACSLPFPC